MIGYPAALAETKFTVIIEGVGIIEQPGALWDGTGTIQYTVSCYDPSVAHLIPRKTSELINLSTRSHAGSGSSTQIAGFVNTGGTSKRVLIRGAGPWLAQFGVSGVLPDPILTLYEGQGIIASNDDWGTNDTETLQAVAASGVPSFAAGSLDACLVATLKPGQQYTAHVNGKATQVGNAIVEVYDLDASERSRVVNISTRAYVGTGSDILIAGFVLQGDGPRKVLVRALGPALSRFGVADVLTDPVLQLFQERYSIAANDNWASDAIAIATASNSVGAAPLGPDSKDAALVMVLDPGVPYTAQVTGRNGSTGNALVEIFAIE